MLWVRAGEGEGRLQRNTSDERKQSKDRERGKEECGRCNGSCWKGFERAEVGGDVASDSGVCGCDESGEKGERGSESFMGYHSGKREYTEGETESTGAPAGGKGACEQSEQSGREEVAIVERRCAQKLSSSDASGMVQLDTKRGTVGQMSEEASRIKRAHRKIREPNARRSEGECPHGQSQLTHQGAPSEQQQGRP